MPLAIAEPPDVLGETALAVAGVHSGTAIALEPVTGFELDAADFAVLRKLGRPLAGKVLQRLARDLCARVRAVTGDVAEDFERAVPSPARAVAGGRPAGPERLGLLRDCAFFEGFGADDLPRVLEHMTEHPVPAGAVVFEAGTPGGALFVVAEGTVEIAVARGARRHRLAVLGPGKVLGEVSLVDRGARSATCAALEDAVLLELSGEVFDELAGRGSDLSLRMLEAIIANLVAARGRLDSARARIAAEGAAPAPRRRPAPSPPSCWTRSPTSRPRRRNATPSSTSSAARSSATTSCCPGRSVPSASCTPTTRRPAAR